jgi:hypothetical protein
MQCLVVLKDTYKHIRKASYLEKARGSVYGTVAYEKRTSLSPILHRHLRGSIARRPS